MEVPATSRRLVAGPTPVVCDNPVRQPVSRALADRIVVLHKEDIGGASQVRVILSGPPGCGKTTTARLVAESLGSVLVSGFDPSRPGQSVHDVLAAMSSYVAMNGHLVFSMDVFDVCIQRAVEGALTVSSESESPEVTDKATWIALMDMLQFIPNVTFIMSTNLTFAELDALDVSVAMLRAGRVTQRFAVDHNIKSSENNLHLNNKTVVKSNHKTKTKRRGGIIAS